jgi:hypothetical protein
MNWMIDGAYGDLYRESMGYPRLQPHDEWEVERNLGTANRRSRTAAAKRYAANAFNHLAAALQRAALALHQPERNVS